MTGVQVFITIALCVVATQITRWLPFLMFSSKKPTPQYIQYLGKALPAALYSMLVVYCLKGVHLLSGSHGLPEAIAILATIGIHYWKRQMLLSIAAGTVVYMILIQFIFV